MIRYFASHPTAANSLMTLIILVGLIIIPTINKETFPEIKLSAIQVTAAYPGASPSEVEKAICNRLEDATDGISFLKEQECVAKDSIGQMTLTMQQSGDLQKFVADVKSAVEAISDFPSNTERPVVTELGATFPVVGIAISAKLTPPELKDLAEYYRKQLLALPQVPIATISGFSTHHLSVLVKAETLRQYKLSVEDIAILIRSQAMDVPVGSMEASDQIYKLRFSNERNTVQSLADLIILDSEEGGQIRLGDIAEIKDEFADKGLSNELNGNPAALIQITKNASDDTLTIFGAVKKFVDQENARLPASTRLTITQDYASVVRDRLDLVSGNGVQGLFLASFVLLLFFYWRYTLWVVSGVLVSFVGGMAILSFFGVTINMISMVALLMAIGILMDDAVVISESIESEYKKNPSPLKATIAGVNKVKGGVISSFATSAALFGGLLFLKGDLGQIMSVIPIVLLSVLSVSLLEAFLILPHHLKHSLEKHHNSERSAWRLKFDKIFSQLTEAVGRVADYAIKFRYATLGGVLAIFAISIGMLTSGVVKFAAFPSIEGNVLQARILMTQGTTLSRTEQVVDTLLSGLDTVKSKLPKENDGELIRQIQVSYGTNADAGEQGEHLATISVDLLDADKRHTSLNELRRLWKDATPTIADAISVQFKDAVLGPAGKAISIRLQGQDLNILSQASWELQHWLHGYEAVSNVMDDLRPGKREFEIALTPGALASGVNAQRVSSQLRAAFQGIKVGDVYKSREAYEIYVSLDSTPENALENFSQMVIFSDKGIDIPLSAIATITEKQSFSKISRINHQRTVTINAAVDTELGNTAQILQDTKARFLANLLKKYPGITTSFEGEAKSSSESNASVLFGFLLGITAVYFLLGLQFKNYIEPIIVMMNIPLALIGVILGHKFMGLDITMPSMIGFVSLAGIVVNDSILLVEFVKYHSRNGMPLHTAAGQAVRERFRAIFITSITTVAGMLPLLSETSLQAKVLIPLIVSLVFGMLSATLLLLVVLPATFTILEDIGFTELSVDEEGSTSNGT